MLIGYMLFNF